ncbi:MAG: hypothetical protein ACETWM_12655 [Candidatus Lokiarchaeia archaeon]
MEDRLENLSSSNRRLFHFSLAQLPPNPPNRTQPKAYTTLRAETAAENKKNYKSPPHRKIYNQRPDKPTGNQTHKKEETTNSKVTKKRKRGVFCQRPIFYA